MDIKAGTERFDQVTDEELMTLVNSTSSKQTLYANRHATRVFNKFVSTMTDLDKTVETINKEELIGVLPKFYAGVRTEKGEQYTAVSLLSLRSSLNRSIAAHHMPCFNLITDPEFQSANRVFKAILKKTRAAGKGKVNHKPIISEADFAKLYSHPSVLSLDTPQGLSNRVFIEICLFFCRRGVQNLALLKKDDFQVLSDASGNRYVTKTTSEQDKNHTGDRLETEETEGGRMYSTGKEGCPVVTFMKYVSKLHPKCDRLFQRPRPIFSANDMYWFENQPLGANTISSKMATISLSAGLSRRYTNHCLRATSITTLSRAGFEARMIRTVSGHKSNEALDSYCRETTDTQKLSMSTAIAQRASATSNVQPKRNSASLTSYSNADVQNPSFALASEFLDSTSNTISINREFRNTSTAAQSVWNIQGTNITINNHYH